jgi:uncharacterized membrane protein YfcA
VSDAIALFVAAFLSSVFGSMVGLGGGFILVPVLRLFFGLDPAIASGTALVLVVANSGSGALTYLLQRRVHIRAGLLIAAGGWPGSIIGALLAKAISAELFDILLAALLLGVALDMLLLRRAEKIASRRSSPEQLQRLHGMSPPRAIVIGFIVGLISSLFGIGGGVMIVPALVYFSDLPAHAISATSHFGIVLTSPIGLATHAVEHDIRLSFIVPLVVGGLLGGPVGAKISLRLRSPQLVIFVGVALAIGAISLVFKYL